MNLFVFLLLSFLFSLLEVKTNAIPIFSRFLGQYFNNYRLFPLPFLGILFWVNCLYAYRFFEAKYFLKRDSIIFCITYFVLGYAVIYFGIITGLKLFADYEIVTPYIRFDWLDISTLTFLLLTFPTVKKMLEHVAYLNSEKTDFASLKNSLKALRKVVRNCKPNATDERLTKLSLESIQFLEAIQSELDKNKVQKQDEKQKNELIKADNDVDVLNRFFLRFQKSKTNIPDMVEFRSFLNGNVNDARNHVKVARKTFDDFTHKILFP